MTYQLMGRYNDALNDLDSAIELYPTNPLTFMIRNQMLDRDHDALVDFDRAIELTADQPRRLVKRGLIDLLGPYDALTKHNHAIELDPPD